MANRAIRSFVVPAAGKAFERRATRLYKLLAHFIPREFLFKFCVLPYDAGIFFLQFYDVLLEQCKLCIQQVDGTMLVDKFLDFTNKIKRKPHD